MGKMETIQLLANLDRNSLERIKIATFHIEAMLNEESLFDEVLHANLVNWWEWVIKEWRDDRIHPRLYIAINILVNSIKKNGIKTPVRITNKLNHGYFLENGCHRVAIAKILGIKEIPVDIRREPNFD